MSKHKGDSGEVSRWVSSVGERINEKYDGDHYIGVANGAVQDYRSTFSEIMGLNPGEKISMRERREIAQRYIERVNDGSNGNQDDLYFLACSELASFAASLGAEAEKSTLDNDEVSTKMAKTTKRKSQKDDLSLRPSKFFEAYGMDSEEYYNIWEDAFEAGEEIFRRLPGWSQ